MFINPEFPMRRFLSRALQGALTVLCILAILGLLDSRDARCVGDEQPSFCAE